MRWSEDWPLFVMLASAVAWVAFAVFVGIQAYRAEPAEIACRIQGMDHARRAFSATVTCVPRAGHGVDTVVVRVPQ